MTAIFSARCSSYLYVALLFSMAFVLLTSNSGSLASPLKKKNESNTCFPVTPCGWLVYQPESRKPDYYVRSPCTCPSDQICVQDHDDIAILAYIYRCRSKADAKGLDVLKEEVDADGTGMFSSSSNTNVGSGGSP